jgi:hypothetical protein
VVDRLPRPMAWADELRPFGPEAKRTFVSEDGVSGTEVPGNGRAPSGRGAVSQGVATRD